MRVSSIRYKDENRQIHLVDQSRLQVDKGLVQDINAKGGDKQVSILSKESRMKVDNGNIKGLCTNRFYENLTIEDIDVDMLMVRDKLCVGDIIQEITQIGKKCFNDCNLYTNQRPCPLSTDVIFTKVIVGGIVKVGQIVTSSRT